MKKISSLVMFTIATILVLNASGYGYQSSYLDHWGQSVFCEADTYVKHTDTWTYYMANSMCMPIPIDVLNVRIIVKLNGVTQYDSGVIDAGANETVVSAGMDCIVYRVSGTNTYSCSSRHMFETESDTWYPRCTDSVVLID